MTNEATEKATIFFGVSNAKFIGHLWEFRSFLGRSSGYFNDCGGARFMGGLGVSGSGWFPGSEYGSPGGVESDNSRVPIVNLDGDFGHANDLLVERHSETSREEEDEGGIVLDTRTDGGVSEFCDISFSVSSALLEGLEFSFSNFLGDCVGKFLGKRRFEIVPSAGVRGSGGSNDSIGPFFSESCNVFSFDEGECIDDTLFIFGIFGFVEEEDKIALAKEFSSLRTISREFGWGVNLFARHVVVVV